MSHEPIADRFSDRTVIVTGAASGIGRGTAERFAAEGARVLALDVQADALDETVATITTNGGTAVARVTDVREPAECSAAVAEAVERWGALHGLANVAGILRSNNSHEATDDEWRLTMGVNLDGVFFLSRAAIPHLLEQRGAIVNVSSTAGLMGQAYLAAYCASKHGVIGLTKAMAIEYARKGLRVNAVCPGGVDTALVQAITFPEEANPHLIMRAALVKETSTPDDIASGITWLASDEARYVNGAVLSIDAGVTAG